MSHTNERIRTSEYVTALKRGDGTYSVFWRNEKIGQTYHNDEGTQNYQSLTTVSGVSPSLVIQEIYGMLQLINFTPYMIASANKAA